MIINLRGTNGSGKSTIVKKVMSLYENLSPLSAPGRRRPVGYLLDKPGSNLFVPGHYEIACGGCDTLKTLDQVYELINEYHPSGDFTLYEGIMVNDDVTRAVELSKRFPLIVISLTTPLDECFRSIRERRESKGNMQEVNPKSTTNRYKGIKRRLERLRNAGIQVEEMDREKAFERIKELLRLS